MLLLRSRSPLDPLVMPTAAYSFRQLLTSYKANKAINVVRASDSATLDIGFAPNGDPDIGTLTAFLSGTTGKLVTIYDQAGTRDLTQATDANRPPIILNAINGYWPCFQVTAGTMSVVASSNITPATGLMSFCLVYNKLSGTGTSRFLFNGDNNSFRGVSGSANAWQLSGGTSGALNIGATDAAWHVSSGTMAAASTTLRTDTLGATGTVTGNTTAGAISFIGAASTVCNFFEGVIWDNITLEAARESKTLNTIIRRKLGF